MKDAIFKGATRPPMWAGVPQLILLGLVLTATLLGMWAFVLLNGFVSFIIGITALFIYFVMRAISADDPHRLNQTFMRLNSWIYASRNKAYWGTHSASPTNVTIKPGQENNE